MKHRPAKDTFSGEPELVIDGTDFMRGSIIYHPDSREFLVWWNGSWCRRSHALPADLVEKIDAATAHREKPEENPWPSP